MQPFPAPLDLILKEGNAGPLNCRRLFSMPLRTQDATDGAKRHPPAVEQMDESIQLRNLKRCTTLWQRLKDYTEPDSAFNTWHSEGPASAIPSAAQQALAVRRLVGWAIDHALNTEPLVNCEMSIDHQIHMQLLHPINILLQTRYRNRISDVLTDETLARSDDRGWAQKPSDNSAPAHASTPRPEPATHNFNSTIEDRDAGIPDSLDELAIPGIPHLRDSTPLNVAELDDHVSAPNLDSREPSLDGDEQQGFPQVAFLPMWLRGVIAAHVLASGNNTWPKAGIPDIILLKSANLHDHGALGELKTFWTVSDEIFDEIFSSHCAWSETGLFKWYKSLNA
ncbi:hypothetical protein EIP91_011891 [Steccherinum ochraceum]|uniref:Uncharacterized protein n=1 Tax=Steccherinum ochraceum TaxID=92696 RepID=A0A4R0RQZ1_9APHY|nr:hypothetical protein EIP91_011891 [Steccherinum ochraceum]